MFRHIYFHCYIGASAHLPIATWKHSWDICEALSFVANLEFQYIPIQVQIRSWNKQLVFWVTPICSPLHKWAPALSPDFLLHQPQRLLLLTQVIEGRAGACFHLIRVPWCPLHPCGCPAGTPSFTQRAPCRAIAPVSFIYTRRALTLWPRMDKHNRQIQETQMTNLLQPSCRHSKLGSSCILSLLFLNILTCFSYLCLITVLEQEALIRRGKCIAKQVFIVFTKKLTRKLSLSLWEAWVSFFHI